MKIWSMPKHENLTTGKKILCKKGRNCFYKEQFLLLSTIFKKNISNFKSPITYIFVKCGCSNYFFLNSANLICRGTDISKYFRYSLGIQDNESRLYFTKVMYISDVLTKWEIIIIFYFFLYFYFYFFCE